MSLLLCGQIPGTYRSERLCDIDQPQGLRACQTRSNRQPWPTPSASAPIVQVANLRIADSQNLANANYSNPSRCSGRLRSRTLERRNGINGGDPRSGEEAVYAGFAYP